jgi:hypothetical protein
MALDYDVLARHRTKSFIDMPNQRQTGTKLAGAYISAEKDKALSDLAALKGYANKAEFIRVLFDDALAENAQSLKKAKPIK